MKSLKCLWKTGKNAATTNIEMTLDEYFQTKYFPFSKAKKRRPEIDKYTYDKHIAPAFGNLRLSDITLEALDAWVLHQVEQGYKPATVNKHTNILNRMLNLAATWNLIAANPFKKSLVRHIAVGDYVQRFLTPPEINRLLDACRTSSHPLLYHFVMLLLLTGARKSELRLAKWSTINAGTRSLNVPISKNGKARRITLSDDALAWLEDLRRVALGMGRQCAKSPYLFTNPHTGKPYTSFHRCFFEAREKAGLPEVRIHDLRHTYASLLINNGASLYEVQKLLGHYHVSLTERYAQLYPDTLHMRASIVGQSLNGVLTGPHKARDHEGANTSHK